jgi:hypothetical protein
MVLAEEQKRKFENMRQTAKDELDRLDKELAEEVIRARKAIEDLQVAKRTVKQIYDSACALLGIQSAVEMRDYRIPDIERQA